MRATLAILIVLGLTGGARATTWRRPGLSASRVVIVTTSIEVFETIHFVVGTADVAPASARMLDLVATTLSGNPDLRLVEIRVRAPVTDLAERRARAIIAALVARGVEPARLRARGLRDPRSLATELVIIDRAS